MIVNVAIMFGKCLPLLCGGVFAYWSDCVYICTVFVSSTRSFWLCLASRACLPEHLSRLHTASENRLIELLLSNEVSKRFQVSFQLNQHAQWMEVGCIRLFISKLMLQCYTSDTIGCLFYPLSSRPQPWQQLRQALALPQSWEEKEEEEEGKRVKGLTGA